MGREEPAADIELFRSDNLLVRAVGQSGGQSCVITFACLLDVPGLEAPGFAEAFLRDRAIDAIHVTCADNSWYQYPELPKALGAIRAAVRPYRRVLAYGSSMGGYAAVRYGGRAGAQEALAISPQFSIDPRLAPFDRRWRRRLASIRFIHESAPPEVAHATVVYDPRSPDAQHVELIAAAVPVLRLRLLYAGHPAGAYLAEAGLLSELVLALCVGDAPPDFERRARAARRRSGQYLFSLARHLPQRRGDVKLALARLAVEIAPSEPVYRSYLGLLLDGIGESAGAEAVHRAAVAMAPNNPIVLNRLTRFVLRRGRTREGIALAHRAHALAGAFRERHLLCAALLIDGRFFQMLRVLRGAAWDYRSLRLLLDLARAIAWRPCAAGWRSRLSGRHVDWLPFHLGTPDEIRSADVTAWLPARGREPRFPST